MTRMAEHHESLLRDLEAHGPEVIRAHIADGLETVRRSAQPASQNPSTISPSPLSP